jgi:NitT/TauT family transport system substrate-binding protein
LQGALEATQAMAPDDLVKALPREIVTGANVDEIRTILARYRASLYPTRVAIDRAAADRVAQSLVAAGLIKADADTGGLYDTSITGG